MIETLERNIHWAYYLALESDLDRLSRYIEFDRENFDVYSLELARFILSASAEVEVVLKELILLHGKKAPRGISGCMKALLSHNPHFPKAVAVCRKYNFSLYPWSSWDEEISPDWWVGYNAIKHDRRNNFRLASLGNALNSVAALYLANVFYAYQLLVSRSNGYPFDLSGVIRSLHTPVDLFRVDDPFAYLSE